MNYKTDKKANARYWDNIDGIIENMIHEIASYSDVEMAKDIIESTLYDDGLVPDVKEIVIKYLTEKGGVFPYVNEDM